jgi:hypothetical protein
MAVEISGPPFFMQEKKKKKKRKKKEKKRLLGMYAADLWGITKCWRPAAHIFRGFLVL